MNYVTLLLSMLTLFTFSSDADINQWQIVDDRVMGGESNGKFELSEEGYGHFYGKVSLENNGGFSMVQYNAPSTSVKEYSKLILRLKGDGKRYQVRVKSSDAERFSYIYYVQTSGDWQTIEVPFNKMEPYFRGNMLDKPNFPGEQLDQLAFLIGNGKEESFSLYVDKIELK